MLVPGLHLFRAGQAVSNGTHSAPFWGPDSICSELVRLLATAPTQRHFGTRTLFVQSWSGCHLSAPTARRPGRVSPLLAHSSNCSNCPLPPHDVSCVHNVNAIILTPVRAVGVVLIILVRAVGVVLIIPGVFGPRAIGFSVSIRSILIHTGTLVSRSRVKQVRVTCQ
jgi:hypothetical protein